MKNIEIQAISKKLLTVAIVLLVVVVGLSAWHFYGLSTTTPFVAQNQIFTLISGVISWSIMIGVYINVLLMLKTIAKERTPFIVKIATHIKICAVLLFSLEIVQYLLLMIENIYFPIINEHGEKIATVYSFGGMLIVSALAIYVVSLVFEYGIVLQKQNDETL